VTGADVDFLSGPEKIGVYRPPSAELVAEKKQFGASRRHAGSGTRRLTRSRKRPDC
jgi:hypothetical protein